jgi:hypothetical protein
MLTLPSAHKAESALSFMQLTEARAKIALKANCPQACANIEPDETQILPRLRELVTRG